MAWLPILFAGLEGYAGGPMGGAMIAGVCLGACGLTAAMHFVVLVGAISMVWILTVGKGGAQDRLKRLAVFLVTAGVLSAVVWITRGHCP